MYKLKYLLVFLSRCMVAFSVFLSVFVHALSLPTTTESLADRSDLVVRGSVIGKGYLKKSFTFFSHLGSVVEENVYTKYDIVITDILKGEYINERINLYSPGGIYEGSIYTSSVEYKLSEGEHVVLFLEFDKQNNIYRPVDQSMGVFSVHQNGDETYLVQKNLDDYVNIDGDIKEYDELNLTIILSELEGIIADE